MHTFRVGTVAAGTWLVATIAAAQAPRAVPFADGGWRIEGKGSVGPVDGRDALTLENGIAYRKDVSLEDGVIEMDVKTTRRRSFVYVKFRMADEANYEEFYLRPHKSGLPDAVQYAPVFQGASAWQLYHGPGGTAAVDFQPGVWTKVRIVLQGRRAALFVGEGTAPLVVVPHLARDPRPGFLALNAFLPQGTPGDEPIARFSNLKIRPGPVSDAEIPAAPPLPAPLPGLVRSWAISGLLPVTAPLTVPDQPALPALASLKVVETERQGFVNLHRHVPLAAGSRVGAVAARLHVRADRDALRTFDLGYSDIATVFVNGRPVYTGDQRYSFDTPRREGLLGLDQARLYLPLRAGDNEVVVLLSDTFGGWALMGRFVDPSGLTVEAR
jgi:hypothetical protein